MKQQQARQRPTLLGGRSRGLISGQADAVKARLVRSPFATLVRRWTCVGATVGIAMLSIASGAWGAPGDTVRIDGVCPHDATPLDLDAISRNGRFVVAECQNDQIYERDRLQRRRILVSRAAGPHGTRGEGGGSDGASVSDDGRIVAFASDATNLAPGVVAGFTHVFVRDLRRHTTMLIGGARRGGARGCGQATGPSISADGRFVAFAGGCSSSNSYQVVVRDLLTNKDTLASRANGARGAMGNGPRSRHQPSHRRTGSWRHAAPRLQVSRGPFLAPSNASRHVYIATIRGVRRRVMPAER